MSKHAKKSRYLPPYLPYAEHPPRPVCSVGRKGKVFWYVLESEHVYELQPHVPDEPMKKAWAQIIAEGKGTEADFEWVLWADVFIGIHRLHHEEMAGAKLLEDREPPPEVQALFAAWRPRPPEAVAQRLAEGDPEHDERRRELCSRYRTAEEAVAAARAELGDEDGLPVDGEAFLAELAQRAGR